MANSDQDHQPPPFWGHEAVPKIDADTAERAIEQGAHLIDLGEPRDWFSGHLPGAHLVEVESADELHAFPKDHPMIVAGRDQGLTEEVVASLREDGYDAALLAGGPGAWVASGRSLVKADGTRA
jgi:rhodanese-related sulfurtransferase